MLNKAQKRALKAAHDDPRGLVYAQNAMLRSTWNNPHTSTLKALVRRGLLEETNIKTYRITEAGKQAAQELGL